MERKMSKDILRFFCIHLSYHYYLNFTQKAKIAKQILNEQIVFNPSDAQSLYQNQITGNDSRLFLCF